MGNKQDRPASPQTQPAKQQEREQAKPEPAKPQPAPAPVQPVDIVITGTANDKQLSTFLKEKLEAASFTTFSSCNETKEESRQLGQVLVDAKMLVFIVSEQSGGNTHCGDQVSLAFISDKPILIAACKQKADLLESLSFGLKLTLNELLWTVFETREPDETITKQFVELVQKELEDGTTADVSLQSSVSMSKAKRIRSRNTSRLHSQSTSGSTETVTDTFWERNFGEDKDIAWFRFQQTFLTEYDAQLKSLFTDKHIPWLLDMLHNDIFGGAESVSLDHFMQIRGDSREKHTFWRVISQIAVEKFNMKEVFNMQSTVRLTAVENLGKFQNPAVIGALMKLLDDQDPNVRAVAAISLGRTGVSDDHVVEKLIAMLKDSDRIVRQSVCLSLGTMKAKAAISHIGNIWRNDFISVVRDAARTALERMEIEEAQDVLKVTRVLEEEIKQLQGTFVAV